MIVEDDDATREAFALILELEGYRVQTATDGLDALERLRSGERPRVIVLDLMMPRMDGAQLSQALARDEQLAGVPILVCTAAGRAGRALFPTPPAGYLDKPIDPPLLIEAVRAAIQRDQSSVWGEAHAPSFSDH